MKEAAEEAITSNVSAEGNRDLNVAIHGKNMATHLRMESSQPQVLIVIR